MKRTLIILLNLLVILCLSISGRPLDADLNESNRSENPGDESWPFSSTILTNPAIEEMIALVSEDQLMANLESLVGFYTRHTNSDTLSSEFGIGAARRMIFDRFQDYADDSLTYLLEPDYFDFNATVCGILRQHRNVLATLPGNSTPARYFLVMGHVDSRTVDVCDEFSFAPSANDDGSGTAIVMEMVRIMSRYSFESTVIIMVVTGEDQGLYGSTAYANWAVSQGMDIGAVITNDVVGNIEGCEDPGCPPGEPVFIDSTSVRHFSGPPDTGISRQLARYMKLKAMEYIDGFTIDLIPAVDRPGRSGDHVPFYNRGYPGVRFTEANENGDGTGMNGRQHNEHDTISAYNTNFGYMANIARINMAGIASLALAPKTPGGLEVDDTGDGTSVILNWPIDQDEPDFSGYRIAVRPVGDLFYSDVIDAGYDDEYILTALTEGQPVYLSISAYDFDENESVFSTEIEFSPSSLPRVPEGLEATSEVDGVRLAWTANTELDIVSYRIYRQAAGQGEPELISIVPHPQEEWFDASVSAHVLYTYTITAMDIDLNESLLSEPVYGQLASHDAGILVLDGTPDGSGGPLQPTDQEVDDFYQSIVSGFDVGGFWDLADSNSAGNRLADAHLAPYSLVFLHSDRPISNLQQDITALRQYLGNGGHLLLSGWNLSHALAGNNEDYIIFPPGSFFREYLKVDSLGVSPSANIDFVSAPSLLPSRYPDLIIDSTKVSIFDHRLFKMEAFLSPLQSDSLIELLYKYESWLGEEFRLHGEPIALKYIGPDFSVLIIDAPLYFMKQEPATLAARQALLELGEILTAVEESDPGRIPESFTLLPNTPNPFNSSTILSYTLFQPEHINIAIYNLLGQEVEVLKDETHQAGEYSLIWNADDYPSGIYFCRLEGINSHKTIRMTLVK